MTDENDNTSTEGQYNSEEEPTEDRITDAIRSALSHGVAVIHEHHAGEARRNAALGYAIQLHGGQSADPKRVAETAQVFSNFLGNVTAVPESPQTDEPYTGFPPYLTRMLNEEAELAGKLDRLNTFLKGEDFRAMDKEGQALLETQMRYMELYLQTLSERVRREVSANEVPARTLFDDPDDNELAGN